MRDFNVGYDVRKVHAFTSLPLSPQMIKLP